MSSVVFRVLFSLSRRKQPDRFATQAAVISGWFCVDIRLFVFIEWSLVAAVIKTSETFKLALTPRHYGRQVCASRHGFCSLVFGFHVGPRTLDD